MSQADVTPARVKHPPIGIDLGTTYSVIAYLDESGRPVTLANSVGDLLTPSSVLVDRHEIIVGREATKASAAEPQAYAECFKRDVGTVVYRRDVRGVQVPPEVLSAFVLAQLKQDAERHLGPLQQVVITVPAFFDESRRKATQDAGRLAGWEVLDIVNEPTAAALAYGHQHGFLRRGPARGAQGLAHFAQSSEQSVPVPLAPQPLRVLVYDLGGGTFDLTILEIDGDQFRAVATDGDVQLGGKDFDERLVDYLAEQFIRQHGADPRSDPQDAAQLWLDAQEIKHTLSQRASSRAVVFHAGVRLRLEITRETFEELTRDLLERTETTTSLIVKEAGLNQARIDRVLLVGGSSRMPMVAEMLERVTGKPPDRSASPDEAIAHGAALYAGMLMHEGGDSTLATCKLINVNSHSLGVVGLDTATRERLNVILIPKNTPLPHRATSLFSTARPNQRNVKVIVLEGESQRPEECITLGDCVVRDLPPGLPQGSKIEVTYSYAANGRISVSARVPKTRQSAHVEIKRNNARELEDLATWRARLLGDPGAALRGFDSQLAEPVNVSDHGSVLRRLDALYIRIGRAALNQTLPDALQRSQLSAQNSATAHGAAQAVIEKATAVRQDATNTAAMIQAESALAHARTHLEHMRTLADFACLVLGRECVSAACQPDGASKWCEEATALRGVK